MVGDSALTVACVLWQGDFRKRTYSPEWVAKLKCMVASKLPAHKFVCLSNVGVPCDRLPLVTGLDGWWAKLELFRPGNGLTGRVLYLDLDVLAVDDLTPLVTDETTFMPASHTFGPGEPASNDWRLNRYQSSAFCFEAGTLPDLYTRFEAEHLIKFRGDQDWIGYATDQDWIAECRPGFATYPAQWFKKLKHCQEGPPPGVKLVLSMPWKNEEASKKFSWVKDLWDA